MNIWRVRDTENTKIYVLTRSDNNIREMTGEMLVIDDDKWIYKFERYVFIPKDYYFVSLAKGSNTFVSQGKYTEKDQFA